MSVHSFFVLTALIHNYVEANVLENLNFAKNYTTIKNNFVEVIREDLKRNNDDYKEILKENKISHSNEKPKKSNIKSSVTNFHKKGYRRKSVESYQEFEDYEDTTKYFSKPENLFKSDTNKSKVIFVKHTSQSINNKKNETKFDDRNKIISLTTRSTPPPTPLKDNSRSQRDQRVTQPTLGKKNKILKFKEFVKRNEAILKNYVRNKNAARTQRTGMEQFATQKNHFKIKPKVFSNVLKDIPRTGKENSGRLPSPELLDMAPAKGGRIQKQRDKGRLCHRHVLLPEGPKYDSGGRRYAPARGSERTRAPRLLLPRCCNCCKKSVLGCE